MSTYNNLRPGEIPKSFGSLYVYQKEVLETYKNASPIFLSVWEILSNKSQSENWLVLLDRLDGEWIEKLEIMDETLLRKVLSEGGAPTAVK